VTKWAALKFVKFWIFLKHSPPNREIIKTSIRSCDQNLPGEIGETRPPGYSHTKVAQRSTKDQVAWWHLWLCLVPSWCGFSRTVWNCWKPWRISIWKRWFIWIRCKDWWCVVLREIDFLIKFVIDSLLISPVEWIYLNTDMHKFESSQKDENRAQSADSSKAGVGNLITIAVRMNCALSLAGRKFDWFYLKFYRYQLWGRVGGYLLGILTIFLKIPSFVGSLPVSFASRFAPLCQTSPITVSGLPCHPATTPVTLPGLPCRRVDSPVALSVLLLVSPVSPPCIRELRYLFCQALWYVFRESLRGLVQVFTIQQQVRTSRMTAFVKHAPAVEHWLVVVTRHWSRLK